MNVEDFPTPDVSVPEIEPSTLKNRIDAGESLTILDTRMESDYDSWRIDGPGVESLNAPYFRFLDDDLQLDVLDRIPEDREVIVLCAKGGASEYVAGRLLEADYDVTHLAGGMNEWARIYEAVEVTDYEGPGVLRQYQRPSSGCLSYLIYHDNEAAVIDPLRAFTDRYLTDAADLGVELTYAIDTHVHADHISGVRSLVDEGVTGVIPAAAVERGITYENMVSTITDGETLSVGDATIEAVSTPGHTSEMTSYLLGESVLVTGDGLFVESVARPDLEAGDDGAPDAARRLHQSLHTQILTLPPETVIAAGHVSDAAEPDSDGAFTARLNELLEAMDVLSLGVDEFVELILEDMPPRPANYEDIIATNLGEQEVDEEEAFTLELGPNNCAASESSLAGD